jgi:clumping factor A
MSLCLAVLWGLDADGSFRTKAEIATSFLSKLKERLFKQEDVNVRETVLMDIRRIHESVQAEAKALRAADATKHEIGKKLLFLFQCDLLPGVSGKILELKGTRDSSKVKHVSAAAKVAGYTFLFLMDAGMLFYIFLFALTQTGPKQNAWFQSFALWLVVEILLVSTAIVFFTHILVPSLIMKDITQIKRRLMDNIRDFNDKVSADKATGADDGAEKDAQKITFNAANFLFVSTRLARQFPDLKESKIITQFSTPWPRQSYLRVQNVSKKYSKKFSALTRSASILLIFFVGNFLSVPPACQDIIVQMTSTTAIGYIVLIHVQLFEIFPALVILPALVVAVIAHFVIQSSKSDAQIKLARLFPARKKVGVAPINGDDGAKEGGAIEVTALDEERKSDSDFDSDLSSESEEAVPIVSQTAHRTRRQSITAGIGVLQALREKHKGAGGQVDAASSSDGTYNFDAGSDVDSNTEGVATDRSGAYFRRRSRAESDELHVALGTPQSSVRVLQRKSPVGGVPVVHRRAGLDSSDDSAVVSDSTATSSDTDRGAPDNDDFASISSISLREAELESKAIPHQHSSRDAHSTGSIVLSEESIPGAVASGDRRSQGSSEDSIELSGEDSDGARQVTAQAGAATADKLSVGSDSSYLHVGSESNSDSGSDTGSESGDSFGSGDLSAMSDMNEDGGSEDSDALSGLSENEAAEVDRQLRVSAAESTGLHRRRSVAQSNLEDDLMEFGSVSEPSSDEQTAKATGASPGQKSPRKNAAPAGVKNPIPSPRKVREVREVKEVKEKPKHKRFEPTKARIPAPPEHRDPTKTTAAKKPVYAMPTKALSMRWDAAEAEKAPIKNQRVSPAFARLVKQKSNGTEGTTRAASGAAWSVPVNSIKAHPGDADMLVATESGATENKPCLPLQVTAEPSQVHKQPASDALAVSPVMVVTAAAVASASATESAAVAVVAQASQSDELGSETGSGSLSGSESGSWSGLQAQQSGDDDVESASGSADGESDSSSEIASLPTD